MTQQTANRRKDVAKTGRYDIYIEIDIDCEELVDACGLDYARTPEDDTQNEICLSLDEDEFCDVFETCQLVKANEQVFGERLLNYELAEYVTKVTIFKPDGNIISFY